MDVQLQQWIVSRDIIGIALGGYPTFNMKMWVIL
jgi:hypothetical protein